ncbi:MAG: chemotaxis protein CheA [Leptospirillia bacterium]
MGIEEDLKAIFFEEGQEHLQSLEEDLIQLESDSGAGTDIDDEVINRIFRSAHTIKGGAGSVGFADLAGFTHTVENVLDQMREHTLGVSRELISVLLNCADCMARLLDAAMDQGDAPGESEVAALVEQLNGYLGNTVDAATAAADAASTAIETQDAPAGTGERTFSINFRFKPDLLESGTDPSMLLSELEELGELTIRSVDSDRVPTLENLNPYELHLGWELELKGSVTKEDLDGVFIFVTDDHPVTFSEVVDKVEAAPTDAASEQPKKKAKSAVSSVRVDTERLDRLINLVGELVIGQARVAQVTLENNAPPETESAVEGLQRVVRELQEEAMGMRMLPVGPTFVQFQRVVRDLAISQGKEVNLEIQGQEVELDKSIIEKIGDPLKHMVRNSVDHGLETSEERVAAGKPPVGTVKLAAYHAEGNIVIEITDDGRGLDAEAIAAKAIREGVIPEDHSLTLDQIHMLVFHAGLSTAKEITDVSGRGVGMDVVRRNIEQLRGTISIDTELGKGSTFKICLPLTLAIIDGMALAVGDETFLIPLLSIVESIRPERQAVESVGGREELVMVRGEALPLIRLQEQLGVPGESRHPSEALVIIVESGGKRYCLQVDDILGQQQVVIKTMEQNYKKVDGVAGATILPDGKVAMILDIGALVRSSVGVGS